MKSLDAAFEVLRDAGKPLDKHQIVRRVLAHGLWTTGGKTPEETIRKNIQVDIRNHGEGSRFRQVAPSVFEVNRAAHEAPLPTPGYTSAQTVVTAGHTAAATRAAGSMSFAEAAEQVLSEAGSREPMHYEKITQRAIAQGLIRPEGKTPATSLNSIIGTHIRQREARGEPPRFVRHERGFIGLAEELPPGLAAQIKQHNDSVRGQVLARLREGSPAEFEDLVAELLTQLGFEEVERTSLGGDGGIDVRGTLVIAGVVHLRMAVQAKRWRNNVNSPTVQQVRGSLGAHEQGLIITTSDFSKGAREEAARADASPVALMDGEQLTDLLVQHEVGVTKETYPLLQFLER